jgi:hypothetical protein
MVWLIWGVWSQKKEQGSFVGKGQTLLMLVWEELVCTGGIGVEQALLKCWWECNPDTTGWQVPLKHVAFVRVEGTWETDHSKLPRECLVATDERADKLFWVFYVDDYYKRVAILGCYPAYLCAQSLERLEPVMVRDLWHSKCWDEWKRYAGALSSDHWFYIPAPGTDAYVASKGVRVTRTQLGRRLELMLCWWKYRGNAQFVQEDAGRLLSDIHEEEMDLQCEQGRLTDLACYWMLVFVCAHDPWLWEVRSHWERSLLEWRVAHYYCKEHHFERCLSHNARWCPFVTVERETDVFEREIALYRRRHPTGPLPTSWVTVPAGNVSPDMLASSDYDVEDGTVVITYRDFACWAWHQMAKAAEPFTRRIHVLRHHEEEHKGLNSTRQLALDKDMHDFLEPILDECRRFELAERKAARARAQRVNVETDLPVIESLETLIAAAKTRFPLCMAQHVWYAIEQGKHPKNDARVVFAKFLIEAGYEMDQVNGVMYVLYEADRDFTRGLGGWDNAMYMRTFGNQVTHMFNHRSAFGCKSLITAAVAGSRHGCPYFKTGSDAKMVPMLLDWAGVAMPDIEDIAGRAVNNSQERCLRDFGKRSTLNVPGFVINHPNAYIRGHNQVMVDAVSLAVRK